METIDQKIYAAAISAGMPQLLAMLIIAQARHETGDYTSNVFLKCNNAFGYKYVGQGTAIGPCTGSPEGDIYAKYMDVEQSTHELTGWIKRRQREGKFPADLGTITTPDQYATLLKDAGYYGDSIEHYLTGLISALQRIGKSISSPAGMGAIVVILALGLYFFRNKIFH